LFLLLLALALWRYYYASPLHYLPKEIRWSFLDKLTHPWRYLRWLHHRSFYFRLFITFLFFFDVNLIDHDFCKYSAFFFFFFFFFDVNLFDHFKYSGSMLISRWESCIMGNSKYYIRQYGESSAEWERVAAMFSGFFRSAGLVPFEIYVCDSPCELVFVCLYVCLFG
jgi:hypothetical protein